MFLILVFWKTNYNSTLFKARSRRR